ATARLQRGFPEVSDSGTRNSAGARLFHGRPTAAGAGLRWFSIARTGEAGDVSSLYVLDRTRTVSMLNPMMVTAVVGRLPVPLMYTLTCVVPSSPTKVPSPSEYLAALDQRPNTSAM